ncbi:MAG: cob(I)alamin adenosyltransferase [Deltaproteobacteria bacterium]|nr:cob(I)alamin adenosyltransferase [Deltaproteobacteria bacterium]
MIRENGLIIVFTGPGKGKTTAALGIALRAMGHGQKTVILQFLKSAGSSGEQFVRNVPLIEVHTFGAGFFKPGDDPEPHREAAAKGWKMAEDIILSAHADILVLDEISHAINFGFLSSTTVLETIRRKKPGLNIVLTGRNMPHDFIEMADIATEMKEVRHIYPSGQTAVKGIDF